VCLAWFFVEKKFLMSFFEKKYFCSNSKKDTIPISLSDKPFILTPKAAYRCK
jgi:hypothetical protein